MPHGDHLEDAADAAEKLEQALESDPPPSKTGKTKQLRSLIHLITSITALIAAVGAFLKTCDHSMTENSYSHLSESIKTLNDNQQRTHDDLVALHGYLDGLTHAPLAAAPSLTVDAGTPAPAPTTLLVPAKPVATSSAPNPRDAGLITFAIQAPPLPSVQSTVANVAPPPFQQAAAAPAAAK